MEGRVRNIWQTCQRFYRRLTNWAMPKRSAAATTEAAHLERRLRFQEGLRRMQNNLGRAFRAIRRVRRRRTGKEG